MNDTFAPMIQELTNTLNGWGETLFAKLPHMVVALLLMGIAWQLGKLARRGVSTALTQTQAPAVLTGLAGRLAHGAIIALGFFMALGLLDLDKPLASLLAGAGVAGLAIGFAFQHTFANFIASVTLALRRPFAEGDLVDVAGVMGRVESSDLRVTHIRTFQGQRVRVPNKALIEDVITNYSTGARRVDVTVGVGYDSDLEEVLELTTDALADVEGRLHDKPVKVFFTGFGGSSIDLVGQVWIEPDDQPGFLAARSDAIVRIKRAYDRAGIDIPYPIRTLDLPDDAPVTLRQVGGTG